MGDKTLTPKEAAAYLNVSVQTLNNWRATKRYPLPFVRIGRMVRYRLSDLQAFLDRHTQAAAGE